MLPRRTKLIADECQFSCSGGCKWRRRPPNGAADADNDASASGNGKWSVFSLKVIGKNVVSLLAAAAFATFLHPLQLSLAPSTPPPLSLAAYDASCWSVEVTITIRPTGHKIKMLHCALPSFPTSPSSSSPLPFPFLVSLLQPRGALIKNAINAIKRRANID